MKKNFFTRSPCNAVGADVLKQSHQPNRTVDCRLTRKGRNCLPVAFAPDREGAQPSFARYFSWQPPQFWNTLGTLALKLASSATAACAAAASLPNAAKRALKS